MKKKLLTLEDLHLFCKTKNFSRFSSKETGYQVVVQAPAVFQETDIKTDELTLYTKFKMFHIGKNRNGSNVTETAAENCLSGIKYKPVLANFCEIDGVKDFTSHDMTLNDDGNINYIEKQVGCFTADEPWIEYDKEKDKKYICAYAAIPREYTDAAEIIERKSGTKVSVELCVNSFSYDAEEDCLNLDDITVSGCTLLGVDPETGEAVSEGMEGSRADIADLSEFAKEKNSACFESDDKLIEVLDKLNNTLSIFNTTQNSQEGGKQQVDKLEELLEKYSVTKEDITFDVEGVSDEDLEKAFEKAFDTDELDQPEAGTTDVEVGFSIDGLEKKFSVSLNEIINALYSLVNATYADADCTWYDVKVYENEVIMIDFWNDKAYKQSYEVENEVYSLTGDRVEVYMSYLTSEEKMALEEMKARYVSAMSELETYKVAKETAEKTAILEDEAYAEFIETEEFTSLSADMDKYSVEDFRDKCDLAYAKLVKCQRVETIGTPQGQINNFAANRVPIGGKPEETKEKKPYGDLFD